MKRLALVVMSALALIACGSEQNTNDTYLAEGESLASVIETLPDLKGKSGADPATVGIYNVSIDCVDDGNQKVSFRIRTQGEGSLNVKAEEFKSVEAKTLYARQVTVNDQNRTQTELDLHQFLAPAATGVFIQISGGSGVAGSYEVTLPSGC